MQLPSLPLLNENFWTIVASISAAVAAFAGCIQSIFVVAAVAYAIRQTRELRRQFRLSELTSSHDQLQRVNELLLDKNNQDLGSKIDQNRDEAFFSIVMGIFHTWWDVGYKEHLVPHEDWDANDKTIIDSMRHPFMHESWNKPGRKEQYPKDFADYIDEVVSRYDHAAHSDRGNTADAQF